MSGMAGLRVGDIVYLQTSEFSSYLCGEGILSDEVFATSNENFFGNCLWEIHVQCQYSATKEFEESIGAIMSMEDEVFEMDKVTYRALLEKMNQLMRSAQTEALVNSKLMAMKLGRPVLFGDIIQLRHLKSRKFLTVSEFQLAKQERENMRVMNDESGSGLSSLTLQPKSRNDKEGMPFKSGSECFIRIQEKSSEFLRAVKKSSAALANLERFEVNCSQEFTSWVVHLFQPGGSLRDKPLMTHWPLTFQDCDSMSNLTISEPQDADDKVRVITTPLASRSPEFQSLYVGTEFLWTVEKDIFTEGGTVNYATQKVTIRHFNTNLYLKVENDGTMGAVKDREPGTLFELHNGGTEIMQDSILADNGIFSISTPMQKKWVCASTTKVLNAEGALSSLTEVTSTKLQAMRMIASKQVYVKIETDLYFGVSAFDRMKKFLDFSRTKLSLATKSLFPSGEIYGLASVNVRNLLTLVDLMVKFLGGSEKDQGVDINGPSSNSLSQLSPLMKPFHSMQMTEKLKADKIAIRQNMMLEQGVLSEILDILELCKAGLFDQVKLVTAAKDNAMATNSKPIISRASSVREIIRRDSSAQLETSGSGASTKVARKPSSEAITSFSFLGGNKGEKDGVKSAIQMMTMSFVGTTNKSPYKVGPSADSSSSSSSSDEDDGGESDDSAPTSISRSRAGSVLGNRTPERRSSSAQIQMQMPRASSGEAQRQTMSEELAQALFRILLLSAKDNHLTQLYLSSRLKVVLDQISSQIFAVKTLREMLRDNTKILQTMITQEHIDIMVRHLEEHEMNVVFLKLLQSTCSCPRGVDQTQRMVVLSLFPNGQEQSPSSAARKMVISLIEDSTSTTRCSWIPAISAHSNGMGYHYVPNTDSKSFDTLSPFIMGSKVVRYGLPKVKLCWEHGKTPGTDGRISMIRLFGSPEHVALELMSKFVGIRRSSLFASMMLSTSSRKSGIAKRNSSVLHSRLGAQRPKNSQGNFMMAPTTKSVSPEELKCQVADFLVAQLYLVADLCLDRNYVSIRILEHQYPYELLISVLKNELISNDFKAPVCKIIRTLWVDREPQVAVVFPNLIRFTRPSWKKMDDKQAKGELTQNGAKVFSTQTFCLVQQIISDYLWTVLNDSKRDEYSFEILELLQDLMKFGFYSSDHRQLQDIITPVVRAMDGIRTVSQLPVDSQAESQEDGPNRGFFSRISRRASKLIKHGRRLFSELRNFSYREYWESRKDKRIARSKISGPTSRSNTAKKHSTTTNHFVDEFWEEKLLSFLESIPGMAFSLSIVLLTCSISISQFFSDDTNYQLQSFYDNFDIFVTSYFSFELILRIYSSLMTNIDPLFFFSSMFNILDFSLVALDLILVGLGNESNNVIGAARVTRIARVLRLLRLLRILRALRLLKKIADTTRAAKLWIMPARYSSLQELDVKSIVSMLRIMSLVYKHVQEQDLDVLCSSFHEWSELQNAGSSIAAIDVYKKNCALFDSQTSIPAEFDSTLLDILMYADSTITPFALELLMMHKNSKHIMYTIVQDIQIVSSSAVENYYLKISTILRDLQRMTEMYEIWQNLATEDNLEICADMLQSAEQLEFLMKKPANKRSLAVESEFEPNEECQNIARNLRAMDCVIGAFETLFDGGREELHPKVAAILSRFSDFIVAFVEKHPRNQMEAMPHLTWFIERVEDDFGADKCVKAILFGNQGLISECNPSYISQFAQKIVTVGRQSKFLSLFLGICELRQSETKLLHPRPQSMVNEVSRIFTGKEWKQHILFWVCAPKSQAYADRSAAMDEYSYAEYPPTDNNLSPELSYHVNVLKILHSCRIGQRLQAIYHLDNLVLPTLEPNCIAQVKIGLGRLLVQILESGLDGVELSENMWIFFEKAVKFLEECMEKVPELCNKPCGEITVMMRVHTREWIEVVAQVATLFFNDLDLSIFGELSEPETNFVLTTRTDQDVLKVIKSLYMSFRQLIERHPDLLGIDLVESCGQALLSIVPHSPSLSYDVSDLNSQLSMVKKNTKKANSLKPSDDILQLDTRKKFARFTAEIMRSEQSSVYDDSVSLFSKVPLINDPQNSDVRLEVLLQKFNVHVHDLLSSSELSGQKNSNTDQAVWILKCMRIMLEKVISDGTTVESSRVASIARATELRNSFMSNNLIKLCIECCTIGVNSNVCFESINLIISALGRHGGNTIVKRHIYELLDNADSTQFFKFIDSYLVDILSWCKNERDETTLTMENEIKFSSSFDREVSLPEELTVVTLVQLLCEGDFYPLKNFMRAQDRNVEQVNIIARLSSITDLLSRHESPALSVVAHEVFKAIRNIIYGLSKQNQEYLILQTEIVPSINRLMRSSKSRALQDSAWAIDLEDLKEMLLNVLVCAMEGHTIGSPIFERIVSGIELNVLSAVISPQVFESSSQLSADGLTSIESKFLQMLETLGKSKEVLDEFGSHRAQENIVKVEVVYENKVHDVYFQLPELAEHLSDEFLQTITDDLDVSSHENKLLDFMRRIKVQFIETNYQNMLKPYGLAMAWTYRVRIQWFMFVLSVVINLLILTYLNKHDNFHLPPGEITEIVEGLTVLAISIATLLCTLHIFIRVPANFASLLENGHSRWGAAWACLTTDLNLIWRLAYLVITVIGLSYNIIFLTALLLEWVALDATTRQVLKAVQYPLRQLAATFFIMLVVANIFAGAYFTLYEHEMAEHHLESMFDAFKLALSYGVRGEYGMGHEFEFTLGYRLILDIGFYFIVLAILRNSFMAIIVDTFGKLREVQYERDAQANNSCFICGVNNKDFAKQQFNSSTSTFAFHRRVTHKTINYVYFVLGIWSQPSTEDNGVQMHVRKLVTANDVSWLPIGIINDVNSHHTEHHNKNEAATGGGGGAVFNTGDGDGDGEGGGLRADGNNDPGAGSGPAFSFEQQRPSTGEEATRRSPPPQVLFASSPAGRAEDLESVLSTFSKRMDDLSDLYKEVLLAPRNVAEHDLNPHPHPHPESRQITVGGLSGTSSDVLRHATPSSTPLPSNLAGGISTAEETHQVSGHGGISSSLFSTELDSHALVPTLGTSSPQTKEAFRAILPSSQRQMLSKPWGESPYTTTLERIRSVVSATETIDGPVREAVRRDL